MKFKYHKDFEVFVRVLKPLQIKISTELNR